MQLAPRALAATAVALGSAIGVAVLEMSVQRLAAGGVTRLDDAVALAVLSLGLVLLLWYLATAVVAIACLARRAIGGSWIAGESRLARAGAPLARRLLGAGAGAAVTAAAVLAPAAAASPMPSQLGDDLGWGAHDDGESSTEREQDTSTAGPASETPTADGPAPDAPSGGTHPAGAGTPVAQPVGDASDGAESTYTVESGDSLWDIAAEHLPASAGPARRRSRLAGLVRAEPRPHRTRSRSHPPRSAARRARPPPRGGRMSALASVAPTELVAVPAPAQTRPVPVHDLRPWDRIAFRAAPTRDVSEPDDDGAAPGVAADAPHGSAGSGAVVRCPGADVRRGAAGRTAARSARPGG